MSPSLLLTKAIGVLLVPPGSIFVLLVAGLLVRRFRPRLGAILCWSAAVLLYVLSCQVTADALLKLIEPPPLARPVPAAQAIVVLGGGVYFTPPEYPGPTMRGEMAGRLRYAAHLHRETRAPILVAGGAPEGNADAEADLMKRVLEEDFHTPVRWVENRSNTTLENARNSYAILQRDGINTVYLVTHAWHMARAQWLFEQAGFRVVPAATLYATSHGTTVLHLLPSGEAMRDSFLFFREAVGMLWFRLQSALGR